MPSTARRRLCVPLLVAAFGAVLLVAPQAADAAGVSATIRTGSTLNVRSAPWRSARIVGTVRNRQRVTIACVITGQRIRGLVRTTTAWDRLSTGGYVSHGYVLATRKLPRCVRLGKVTVPRTARYVVGTVKSADGGVNQRTGASTSAPVVAAIASGSRLHLACSVRGELVEGAVRTTTQWDRTSAGLYISHAYLYSGRVPACGTGHSAAVAPVSMTPAQFIRASVPGAQQGWRAYGVPPSVTIAQAILESGWGRSALSAVDSNYFGIKCQGGHYGPIADGCRVYRTRECSSAVYCFDTTAPFRTYPSRAYSFRDHGRFLKVHSRYAGAFAYTRNPSRFIWKIWKAGYATDPDYYTKVTALMAAYDLYRYDIWNR